MVDSVIANLPINASKKGITVLDVSSSSFIKKLAEFFKEKSLIKLPSYSIYVKTRRSNEVAPIDSDWFFYKSASLARKIYLSKSHTFGIGTLKSAYRKKFRRGTLPSVTSTAGGKIIRDIVKQLKSAGYVENYGNTEGVKLGLLLTKSGKSALDKVAATLKK